LTISQITSCRRWAKISAELENRTDNDVKNRWHSHKRSAEKIRRKQEVIDNVTREHTKSPGIVYHFDTDSVAPVDTEDTLYNQDLRRISKDLFDETGLQVGLSRAGQFNDASNTPPVHYRNKRIGSTLIDEMIIDRGLFGFATYAVSNSEQATAKQSMCGAPFKTKVDDVEAFDSFTFPNPRRPIDLHHPQALKPTTVDEWLNLPNIPLTTFTPTPFESFVSMENTAARSSLKLQTDFQGYVQSAFSPMYGLESMSSDEIVEE